MNKKSLILTDLFRHFVARNSYIFNNNLVKSFCKKHRFGDPFDVTKLDGTSKFSDSLITHNYFLVHLGKGRHQFVKGIEYGFHEFEKIEDIVDWEYRKSLLNEFDTSESNILSVGFNQRIIHDFSYEDM